MLRLLIAGAVICSCALADTADSAVTATEANPSSGPPEQNASDLLTRATKFLGELNTGYEEWAHQVALASWAYESNLTDYNLQEKLRVSLAAAAYNKLKWQEIKAFPWQHIQDAFVRRQYEEYAELGMAALPDKDYEEYEKIISQMTEIYSTAKICGYNDSNVCDLSLEPDLTQLMAESRDPEELKHIWVEWREATGKKIKPLFPKYVELGNAGAVLNNVSDTAALWLQAYETDDFEQDVESLWAELRPLYLELHTYVRYKLREIYGEDIVSRDGPIPAHLLGNMWGQTWGNIAEMTMPYPGKKQPDVTENMIEQGYNATKIFRMADSFFQSINLSAVPDTFWTRSILEKPQDGRELICHASAWEFYDREDVRIKQCTRITMEDLFTAHHEMGHIQYFMQYKDQPIMFREGANPGFHEAIGDTISLSVSTLQHLRKIGLLEELQEEDPEAALNNLYLTGLEKIAFLPFGYMIDKWRWGVFRGQITPDRYNCEWWKLREELQGLEPPVDRTEEDFDAASKYHVVADVEYLRYFVSFVIQFQFHKALCEQAGQYDPTKNLTTRSLYDCDIHGSAAAGNRLGSMLQMGLSKPWPDAMEVITGQRKMEAAGLLEYFAPLHEWLKAKNQETGEYIGWKPSTKRCVQTPSELESDDELKAE